MRTTAKRADHPNPTPTPKLAEVRPDEYIFAAEFTFDTVVPGEDRLRALSEHFGAGVLS